MIHFLNPIVLFGIPLCLIPLIIHIFNRQRIKKLDFSSILLLKSFEKTKLKSLKLKQLLLLILRTLIILLAVISFARPTLKGSWGNLVGSKAKTSAVILLDNSFSMNYQTKEGSLLEIAKKKGEALVDLFSLGDEVSLVLFNSQTELLNPQPVSDFKLLKNEIKESTPSYNSTDVIKALTLAQDILKKSKNLNKEIYLLSDLNKTGWFEGRLPTSLLPSEGSPSFGRGKDKNTHLYLIKLWNEGKTNWAITSAGVSDLLVQKDSPLQVQAKLENFSTGEKENLLISLYLDGKRQSQTDVKVEPEQSLEVDFTQSVRQAGIHYGYFEAEEDELLEDNRRYFVFDVPEEIKVLLVGSKDEDLYYLSSALNPLPESTSFLNISSVSADRLSSYQFSKYQVLIFSDVSFLPLNFLAEIERFLKGGGGVLFALGGKIDSNFYNENVLKKLFNLTVKPFEKQSPEGFLTLEKIAFDYPIFNAYQSVDKTKIPKMRFFKTYRATPLSESFGGKVLARYSNGDAALIENKIGSGKAMLFLSSFNPRDNDLVNHTLFIPFIYRSVEYLATDLVKENRDFLVGSTIQRDLDPNLAGKSIKLATPENKEIFLKPNFSGDRLEVEINETSVPGIYNIMTDSTSVDRLAINLDPQESNLRQIKKEELEKMLAGFNLVWLDRDENMLDKVKSARYGKELWQSFLWAILVLIFAEMFLSRTTKREMISESQFG
jgi:SAM-dependent methyltransferase